LLPLLKIAKDQKKTAKPQENQATETMSTAPAEPYVASLSLAVSFDPAINYSFQQTAIPVVKELLFQNDGVARKDLVISIATEPTFAASPEILSQSIEATGKFHVSSEWAFHLH